MADGILKNRYPCCNAAAYLSEPGTYSRRCRGCSRSFNVTVAPSAVLPVKQYGVVMVATWEDRQFRRNLKGGA